MQLKPGDATWRPVARSSASPRTASDGTDEDVAHYPRYYEHVQQRPEPLNGGLSRCASPSAGIRRTCSALPRTAAGSPRWKQLNEIRAFVAREHGAIVQLAEQAWDPERFAEGQLVLLTSRPGRDAPSAARDFVYRLPNLDVPLRVEDVGETELIIDCGEQDLVRVEHYLNAQRRPSACGLTLDSDETDKQIKRERTDSGRRRRPTSGSRALIGEPTLARSTPWREPVEFINPDLDRRASSRSSRPLSPPTICSSCRDRRGPARRRRSARSSGSPSRRTRTPRSSIAAQTHQAVDNVLLRLAKQDPDLPIVRVASEKTIGRVDETIRERYWIDHNRTVAPADRQTRLRLPAPDRRPDPRG